MVTRAGIFLNGLKGADLIIYNVILLSKNRINLTSSSISYLTTYHPNTVLSALRRLERLGLIERRRERRGQRYTYHLKG
jgi:predicted transcriptional regulator